ncbi:MAG: sodium:proton antiporter [Myxococcota bacterium]|nr:sodium:proton antiporter [Myxococcota bacterium]
MLAETTLVVATTVALYALVSRRLDRFWVTGPMVFVAAGLVLGPQSLGVLTLDASHEPVRLLAELTLALVLFADASRIDLGALRAEAGLPVRLLAVAMPLGVGLGAGAAKLLLPELGWLEAATLGALLAPTDAALGQAVLASPRVPQRIRQTLNVESGLNDGIALPAVAIFAGLAGADERGADAWLTFVLAQLGLGPLVGVATGWLGGRLLTRAHAAGTVSPSMERVAGLSLALTAWALAEAIGGNGFIAAFVAGASIGAVARARIHHVHTFLEAEGELMMVLVFLMFGSSLLWPAVREADLRVWIVVALALTVVRMLPVALSLLGSGARAPTVVFLGWFGPRGLATVLFGLIVIADSTVPHAQLLERVAFCAAGASVLVHGLSALPGARVYGRWARTHDVAGVHPEVTEHPLRRRG